jgi:hypothetical protein
MQRVTLGQGGLCFAKKDGGTMRRLAWVIGVLLAGGWCMGQQTAGARLWMTMDRGPFFTGSVESPLPQRLMTPKAIIIKVDPKGPGYVVFDEDLLQYSAGWTGSVDWHGVVFDGSHQTWLSTTGDAVFGNDMTPGWGKEGSFEDPRPKYHCTDYRPLPQSWQERGFGPLPEEWGRYKGLYLNGQRVVLKYTVGGVEVLDSPGWEEGAFTRTINVAKSTKEMVLKVMEHGEGPGAIDGAMVVMGKVVAPTPAVEKKKDWPKEGLVAGWVFENDGVKPSDARYAAKMENGHARVENVEGIDLSHDFSVLARVKTQRGGTIFSKTSEGIWVAGGKTLFIENGVLTFDLGGVGAVRSGKKINDGAWHEVGLTYRAADGAVQLYVDGEADGKGNLKATVDPKGSAVRMGFTSKDFPRGNGNAMAGTIGQVSFYGRSLAAEAFGVVGENKADLPVATAVVGEMGTMRWEIAGQQVRLHIPAQSTPARIKLRIGRLPAGGAAEFTAAAKNAPAAEDLTPLTQGGPARWAQKLETQGKLGGDDKAYTIDRLTLPNPNPWHARMRVGGFDFFKDGKRAAVATWDGDVWIVDGIDAGLEKLTWQRIATGLFQPLGLKIVPNAEGQEQIYVSCRDQIVRLHDLNGDGEADFYECFNGDHQVTEHFHEFAMGLETDAEGNFYYAKAARHGLEAIIPQHGTILKVSKDGKTTQIICGGFRAPNGMGIGPKGEIVTSDEEGYWMPANRIQIVKPGGFYGNMWAFDGFKRKEADGYDPPLCWIPPPIDRSPSEEKWVSSDRWGPLNGNMIHTSYGMGKLFLVLYEEVDGVIQGGLTPMPGMSFGTGVMRERFNPADGQLYVGGLVGWSSNTSDPGGLFRVRYTGKPVDLPTALEIKKNGILIRMTRPLDRSIASDPGAYSVRQWQYRWSKNYGSKQYSIEDPAKVGQDNVDLSAVKVSADGKELFLEIPDLKPVMQMQISAKLKAADGSPVELAIINTINKVPEQGRQERRP